MPEVSDARRERWSEAIHAIWVLCLIALGLTAAGYLHLPLRPLGFVTGMLFLAFVVIDPMDDEIKLDTTTGKISAATAAVGAMAVPIVAVAGFTVLGLSTGQTVLLALVVMLCSLGLGVSVEGVPETQTSAVPDDPTEILDEDGGHDG